mmetsp:Transcript_19084/g.34704  ORF Transcript_19084/g.34704 Transcript_19084/m.34704 type:complete len:153 (+) Transcript_19084:419-877(+)
MLKRASISQSSVRLLTNRLTTQWEFHRAYAAVAEIIKLAIGKIMSSLSVPGERSYNANPNSKAEGCGNKSSQSACILSLAKGYFLIIASTLLCATFLFWLLVVKAFPNAESDSVLGWMQQDSYYCCILPLLVPTTFLFAYSNWLSLKYFRHN